MPEDIEVSVADSASATERMGELRSLIERTRDELATATENQKRAAANLANVENNIAIETMRTLGLTSYEFADGATIKREQKVYASITEANEAAAFDWLRKNGHGALLKTRASIEFGRNEAHLAEVLQAFCARMVPQYEIDVTFGSTPSDLIEAIRAFVQETFPKHELAVETVVHGSTLRSFVKKQLSSGHSLPECFNVFAPQVASLEIPKSEQAAF